LSLCGVSLVLQATILDCFPFDPFSHLQNGLTATEVNVGGRQILQALVIAPMIVVLNEATDVGFEIAR